MVGVLTRKLRRDLYAMKGQAAAIGLVVAMGVMMQVMMSGLYASLTQTRDAYYERYRFADVFAPAARAPDHLAASLATLDGVAAVETRISGAAQVNVAGRTLPVQARIVSLPVFEPPRLNDVYISAGRGLDGSALDEILLLEGFAKAHDLVPGDTLSVTLNGARYRFRIAGLAQAPEFSYTSAPGELVPDDGRFAVIWVARPVLAAAFDMKGAFNEALIGLSRGARLAEVIAATDAILKPSGGFGAYGRADQFSDTFITQELVGLEASSLAVPPIFMAVAAFLLTIVMGRMVQAERQEIGLMKAFGYRDREVAAHYYKVVLVITLAGALVGCGLGILAGRALIGVYADVFKFPILVFILEPRSFVTGVGISVLVASLGGLFAIRRVFSLTPAVAMRPPSPPDFAGSGAGFWTAWLDQPSKMVLRRVTRQPVRMFGAAVGIAAGMGLSVAMLSIFTGFNTTLDLTFSVVDRSDARVGFVAPISQRTIYELAQMPGVLLVEPQREVGVVMRNGTRSHKGGLTGLAPDARLIRAVDDDMGTIALPGSGIVLSTALAKVLGVGVGDLLQIEVQSGARPVLELPVSGIAQSLLGAPAWMDLAALNRALNEPLRVTGAALLLDENAEAEVYSALKAMPAVAGVSLKSESYAAFKKIMNQGAGGMRFVIGAIAFALTFGIVYNAARVAQAERSRDIASLRVMGFHTSEAAFVLLGELAVVVLVALPMGAGLGVILGQSIATGFSTELYQVPSTVDPAAHGTGALIVLSAALVSGWLVRRDMEKTDLMTGLKTRA